MVRVVSDPCTTDDEHGMYYQIIVEELSVDPIANTSLINIVVEAWRTDAGWTCTRPGIVYTHIDDWYVTAQEWANNEKTIDYESYTEIFEVSLTVNHEPDGSKEIYVSSSMRIWNPYTGEPYIDSDPEFQGVSVTLTKLPGLISLQKLDAGTDWLSFRAQTPGALCDKWWYSIDNGSTWVEYSTEVDSSLEFTVENLMPYTTYPVIVKARLQDGGSVIQTPMVQMRTKNYTIQSATRITLFPANATNFTTNGLGSLSDTTSCVVTEEKNGVFELTLQYPITGVKYEEIQNKRIILAKPNQYAQAQPFRIYAISRPINGIVTVNAEHISYDLSGITVAPFSGSGIGSIFQNMKNAADVPCNFDFWSDISTQGTLSSVVPTTMRSLLGGDGSILDLFGGEYEFDIYDVKLWSSRGQDRGVTIRYGKNLTSIKQDENCSNVYTGVRPYWFKEVDGEDVLVTLPEKIVNVSGTFDFVRILPLDLSSEFDEAPTEEELRYAATLYIAYNNIGVPEVSLEVSFIQLSDSNEYSDLKLLERVQLCDYIRVYFPKLGVTSASAQCVKTVYNVLTQRYDSIELGTIKNGIASTISNQNQAIKGGASKSDVNKAINDIASLIGNNGLSVYGFTTGVSSGTDGYVRVGRIMTIQNGCNSPIKIRIFSRYKTRSVDVHILFTNSVTTDNAIASLKYDGFTGTAGFDFFAVKMDRGMWDLYVHKCGLDDVVSAYYEVPLYLKNRMIFDFAENLLTTKPQDAITATTF